ncbi:hypothetical protein AB7X38_19395 [Providencia vermicola]
MNKFVELFCHVDDFCKFFIPQWQAAMIQNGERKRGNAFNR